MRVCVCVDKDCDGFYICNCVSGFDINMKGKKRLKQDLTDERMTTGLYFHQWMGG